MSCVHGCPYMYKTHTDVPPLIWEPFWPTCVVYPSGKDWMKSCALAAFAASMTWVRVGLLL